MRSYPNTDVYELHRQAFRDVSAYVVLQGENLVATVAFRREANGAGLVYCYLQIAGTQMVRAFVPHGGRERHTAALQNAVARVQADSDDTRAQQITGAFRDAVTSNGSNWDQDLRRAGFRVWQAV
jgi:hypothetical protein